MMELFTPNGHLTEEALLALTGESLNEMERLEVSEHLSFCDDCLTAYLSILDDTTLLEPAQPLADKVLKTAKRKGRGILFARYTSVAAAAALAATLWGTGTLGTLTGAFVDLAGAFDGAGSPTSQSATMADENDNAPRAPLGTRFDNALASLNNRFNSFFGGTNEVPTPETSEELDMRAQREALFETGSTKSDPSTTETNDEN